MNVLQQIGREILRGLAGAFCIQIFKPVAPTPLTDQEILNKKCHDYLKGDHW